ncbi:MAG: glycosyltransferase family 4 protein [Planctomycetota bacterium]|jgi:glycosyltransferase involved in cell wall biosynthesis
MPRKKRPALRRVALIGNSLPRQCGIATFTCDLADALSATFHETDVYLVPINDVPEGYDYPDRVWFEIAEKEIMSYRRAADFLNINNVDVVSLQHEFGIYGGPAGGHIISLLRELRMPTVTTLHTILRDPEPDQRKVMSELAEWSDTLVVMTSKSAELLRDVYSVPNSKIEIVPHGIHDVPFVDPSFYKDKFGVEGKHVLLTFGLLGPGKGIERAIEALPAIVERHPDTVYIILGATHPTLKRQHGELYRLSLQQLAKEKGVEANVIFHNRFVSVEELGEFLGAADIYVTPYPNLEQAVSGTLAYAAGAGKAIVSTPYWHAEELLSEKRGMLVPVGDVKAMSEAVIELLDQPVRRDAIRKRAYLQAREMTWPKIARRYMDAFERARDGRLHRPRLALGPTTLEKRPAEPPLLKLDHLQRLTDGTGMLQHATWCVPNYDEGYTTDDNARALMFTVLAGETAAIPTAELWRLGSRYMAFLQYAYNSESHRFRNFLGYDHRRWLEELGSEDSHGRALRALGTVVARWPRQGIREWAGQLFEAALPPTLTFTSPRAWAHTLLGIHEYLTRFSGDRTAEDVRYELAGRLLTMYQENSSRDWPWFEDQLAYSNAKLPHALLVAGRELQRTDMTDAAIEALGWVAQVQCAHEGHFVPIGNRGFYPRDGERARFDQQPIEAQAMVSACLEALVSTGELQWMVEAERAFDWFVGRNDLRTPVYDPGTGGCHDGLEPDHVNCNQGAESTLAFLLSLVQMRLAESEIGIATLETPAAAAIVEPTAPPIEEAVSGPTAV